MTEDEARDEATAQAGDIIAMPWQTRKTYMETLMQELGQKVCLECWYADPRCQCSNDE